MEKADLQLELFLQNSIVRSLGFPYVQIFLLDVAQRCHSEHRNSDWYLEVTLKEATRENLGATGTRWI